jgi:hypothetical protein
MHNPNCQYYTQPSYHVNKIHNVVKQVLLGTLEQTTRYENGQ